MLPSKSRTPFLGIWYEKDGARLLSSPCFPEANEEKVLRASVRPPTTSFYSEKQLLHITREFCCESPARFLIKLNFRLLSVHLGVAAGTLRGSIFFFRHGSLGVHLTRLRALCLGTPTIYCTLFYLKSLIFSAILARCFIRVSCRVLSSELVERKQKILTANNVKHASGRAILLTSFCMGDRFRQAPVDQHRSNGQASDKPRLINTIIDSSPGAEMASLRQASTNHRP